MKNPLTCSFLFQDIIDPIHFPEEFPSFTPSIDESFPNHFDISAKSTLHDEITPLFPNQLSENPLFNLYNYFKNDSYAQVRSKRNIFNTIYGTVESTTNELENKPVSFDESTEGSGDFVKTFEENMNMSNKVFESRASSEAYCDSERTFDEQICLLTKKFDVETHSNASSISCEQAKQPGRRKELRTYTPVKCNAKPWPLCPLHKSSI